MEEAIKQVRKDIHHRIKEYLAKEFPNHKLVKVVEPVKHFKQELYGFDGIKVLVQEIGGKIYWQHKK